MNSPIEERFPLALQGPLAPRPNPRPAGAPIRLTHRVRRKCDVCRSHGLCRGQRGGSRTIIGGGGGRGDSIFES
jgi:hypothetical protein